MQLEFSIIKQNITRTDRNAVVEGSKNYLTAHFTFTEEWNGTKTAIFKNGKDIYTAVLDNDTCLVPWEVITAGIMYVSVFCGNLITADTAAVEIGHTGYAEGETPKPATPDVYAWIMQKIHELEDGGVTDDRIKELVRQYFEEHPLDAVTEDEMVAFVADYFIIHRAELKGDTGERGPQGIKGDKGDKGEKGDSGGIPYDETVVADANKWLTTGYIKTSKELPTINLPSELQDTLSMWGVLFFVCENAQYGTGTQMFFPVSGPYGGRIYTRSITDGKTSRPIISAWYKLATTSDN